MASEIRVDTVYNESGDSDSGLDMSTNDVVAVKIAGSEKARVHSDGKVGIGESAPSSDLVVKQSGSTFTTASQTVALFQRNTATGSGCKVTILSGNNTAGDLNFGDAEDEDIGKLTYDHSDNSMRFTTNAAERMRIDSSGDVSIGNNDPSDDSPTVGFQIDQGGGQGTFINVGHTTAAGNGYGYLRFFYNGSNIGQIAQSNTNGVTYNTSSDYRLKENVVTDWDATTRLKQLKPSRFNFKTDKDTTVDGFLAHEVSSIVPEAITGEKDAVDKDGKPIMQGIDQSKLVPLLVKTIQELEARITALEAK